jgi:alkylation response protein AidB-like acyl-CoA dehydrogenase
VIAALELDAERAAVRDAVAAGCGGGWAALAELGVLAAGADGESGARELVASCEALGAAATAGPLVETVIALRVLPEPEREAVAQGRALASVGAPPLMPHASAESTFVWLEGGRAWRARATGPVESVATLGGEPWGRVSLARDAELPGAPAALAAGRLACAALLAAAGRTVLERAAEHARTRKQFGRAIGEFQAVAHPLAAAWIRVSAAEMLARAAAHDADAGAAGAPSLAAAAWLSARGAALAAAQRAHQTFGAAGITLDGPLFPFTRRIRTWASLALDEADALRLAAEQAGLSAGGAP